MRTGEAIAAPALNNVACYKVEKRGERFFVTGKGDKKSERKPKTSPASVVIIGAGAAGAAAAEMLRREGYDGPVTLIGAGTFLICERRLTVGVSSKKRKSARRAVVIGSSFIGLEVAWSLRERKL